MTEFAGINEHPIEIANLGNKTENIQSFSCPKTEAINLPLNGQQR